MFVHKLKNQLPVKVWSDEQALYSDETSLQQINHLSLFPAAYHHVVVMPDFHAGYGMPIGGVLATEGVIIPNAVGLDISCGMLAIPTSLSDILVDDLKKVMSGIRKRIPVGFDHRTDSCSINEMPHFEVNKKEYPIVSQEFASARKQLGTLGGGNHFIEIQEGSDGFIWFMIHSGSRNLGYKVARHHNKVAIKLNERWRSGVPKKWELAFLPIETDEAKIYLREMEYCMDFASLNRKKIAVDIITAFREIFPDISVGNPYHINHNYARWENHFGKNVIVHRKGATSARKGELGIIPGSQGTTSYIVKGLGNPESFMSCSHGAGRTMSRTQAKKELSLEAEQDVLNSQGIVHNIRNLNDLDEAPSAYKPIQEVMDHQKDLVEIIVTLRPLGVIKG